MQAYKLPIHFGGTGKHEINADSLRVFIEAYKEIFEEVYGSKIIVIIGVPEEGGWKTILTMLAVLGTSTSFIGIDNLSILIRGKPSGDLFYAAHEAIKTFITQEVKDAPECPRKWIEQKNKIYQQFQKDRCIDSFDLGDCPPIPRNKFYLYIKELPDDEALYLGMRNITVSSPDWKGKRSWRGKIDNLEDAENTFDFDKDLTGKFWENVKLDKLPLHTQDIMSVQLLERPNNKVKYRVIRVLKYNDMDIDSPINDEDIAKLASKMLSSSCSKITDEQLDLFYAEKGSA